ncbi:MAG: hypothetical protein A2Y53_03825 [Chloroflexi bacterium RBG_16_47_49]|nr:MAG: hypothetical protein A2Y53_03825 [Chloroflexi bacterium RBG_16_47_49]
MKHRNNQRVLNEGEYEVLKRLISMGFSTPKIHALTGRSTSTLSFIGRSSSFAEYKSLRDSYLKDLQTRKTNGKGIKYTITSAGEDTEYRNRFEQKILNRLDTIIKIIKDGR